jgi:RimJ/RimL family protein N-acetyltransferase
VHRTIIETSRLRLRELVPDDVEDLHAVLGEAETMRFYPHPLSLQETAEWIERSRWRYRTQGHGLWALILKENGELVGDCGLTVQRVGEADEIEIGYHVKRTYWRQGLATEAAVACRDHAFQNLGVARLICIIRPQNIPSQGVARNIGMRPEKEVIWAGLPHVIFAMERPELSPVPDG